MTTVTLEFCKELPADCLKSVSGVFSIDINGKLISFEPSETNSISITEEIGPGGSITEQKYIESMVIPEGVVSLPAEFMRWYTIGYISFPSSLKTVGDYIPQSIKENHSVLANCVLQEVVIPKTVSMIGNFAFGKSHIQRLVFDDVLICEYARQFTDAVIEELIIPKAMWDLPGWNMMSILNGMCRVDRLVLV